MVKKPWTDFFNILVDNPGFCMDEKEAKAIDCLKCAHFYVTWDRDFPNGCRALGFKSRQSPSQAVLSASGIPCECFMQKKTASIKKTRQ